MTPTATNNVLTSALSTPDKVAREFAQARDRWHRLSADRERWSHPVQQRELAVAFLRYHAAKLALTEAVSHSTPR